MASIPILFLHGLGSDKHCFAAARKQACFRNRLLLFIDLPAHGTAEPLKQSHSLSRVRKHLAMTRKHDCGAGVHVIAHSMGAALALLLQGCLPLRSLINVEGNLLPQDAAILSRRTAETDKTRFIQHHSKQMLAKAQTHSDAMTRQWGHTLAKTDAAAFHDYACSTTRWSDSCRLYRLYHQLDCPKCYIYGEKSGIASVIDRLTEDGLATKRIEEAGHFAMLEKPYRFWHHVRQFYQEHEIL